MQGKHFALTYSNIEQQQTMVTKESLWTHLWKLPGVSDLIVAEEKHQDGSTHYHAYVGYAKKTDIKNSRYFDFNGCHPNVQLCKKVQAWKTYVRKDGNFLENETAKSIFAECHSMDLQSWIEYCVKEKIQHAYCDQIWKMCHQPRENTITERPDKVYQTQALKDFSYENWNTKSLIIYGESGVGKTNWAKWHMELPSLFVSHMDVLRDFDPCYHKSIIFDDVSFLHMPRETQIHIVDTFDPRAIHCRYKTANIPAKTPKVFTANKRIVMNDPAINRRIHVVKVNNYNYE